jgi:hypothetical protein
MDQFKYFSLKNRISCVSNNADIIVSIHIKIYLLLITFLVLSRLSLFYTCAGLAFVYNISYKLCFVVMKFSSVLCYLCAESTATRPVTETAQCR